MKILVTGANGYIGRHAVKAFLEKGHTVIAVGRQLDQVDARATKIVADIFNPPENPFITWHQPDTLLHLAWQDGFIHNASSHIEVLPKHLRFVQSMIDAGLQQLIVMGSMHEVGFYEGQINEETPCRPTSFYGIAKNILRQALERQKRDLSMVASLLHCGR
jgi:nucleoside-diphosphate-sugar epimerase